MAALMESARPPRSWTSASCAPPNSNLSCTRRSAPGRSRWTGTSSKSADLVRRFVDLRSLNGCALIDGGTVMGYAYFVLEEHKGLIGDLYMRRSIRTGDGEARLLNGVLDEMMRVPNSRASSRS